MKAHNHAKLLAKNYKCLLLMCERHPAHSKVKQIRGCGRYRRAQNNRFFIVCTKRTASGRTYTTPKTRATVESPFEIWTRGRRKVFDEVKV